MRQHAHLHVVSKDLYSRDGSRKPVPFGPLDHRMVIILQFKFSCYLFVSYLLGRLQTNWHQTWQEGRGWLQKCHWGISFQGNQPVAMATKKRLFLWPYKDCCWV